MELLLLSFVAGVVTVLAPCVLPLLPIIIGSGVSENRLRPVVIIASFALSVIGITLLLKRLVTQFGILPDMLTRVSAVMLIVFGFFLVVPKSRARLMKTTGLERTSQHALRGSGGGIRGDVLLGVTLGPVFNACSPTYGLLVATILPQNTLRGIINMLAYVFGLSVMLLLIARGGRAVIQKVRPLADPSGRFKKVLGVILIVLGSVIRFGRHKEIEAYLIEKHLILDTTMRETNTLQRVGTGCC